MVLTHTDVAVGIVDGAPLTDDDVAGFYGFAAKLLEAETLAMGFTTVLRTGLTFLVCHNDSCLSDCVDLDLGELLTVTVELLETFATDLLENEDLVCAGRIIEDGGLHDCTLDIGGSYLDGLAVCYEENLGELHGLAVLCCEAVDKNLIAGFDLKLLACNVYDSVHIKLKLLKFRPQASALKTALYQWLNGHIIFGDRKNSIFHPIRKNI